MRLALQRLLASPSALSTLRSAVQSSRTSFFQHHSPSTPTGQTREYAEKEQGREQRSGSDTRALRSSQLPAVTKDDRHAEAAIERNWHDTPQLRAPLPTTQRVPDIEDAGISRSTVKPGLQKAPVSQIDIQSDSLDSRSRLSLITTSQSNNGSWRDRLVTFEQHGYESDLETPALQGLRLVDDPSHAQDWDLWLELIVFRKRHHGAEGTIAIYKEIFRRGLRLPTLGVVADQLWDLLIRAGYHRSGLLKEIVVYAIQLKRSTGRSWPGMYYGIVSVAFKKDPGSAYRWHMKLREDFRPSLEDYKKIFNISLDRGSSAHFRDLYKDTPLAGMYRTVIWQFCKLQMYDEALKWHDLLYGAQDYPDRLTDIKPLLDHLAYVADGPRLERIFTALAKVKVGFSEAAECIIPRDAVVSPEIMNRQLGEVHGIGPKHLSDSFCARLFATRFFSIDTIISGLHIMAVEVIGPLSFREIALRDNCDPGAICDHIDALKAAEVSLDNSLFCTLVRSLAVGNKQKLLQSVVACDLHPDTFADSDLQERLLAQYYEERDLTQIDRTLAILTTGCSTKDLQMVRMNLILRCQITLREREKVLATLGQLKHMDIPLTARSSRHLRVCWLSRRQVGRGAAETRELAILIKASQMTMESGSFVPIISWREILRRLGMAGLLTEFENLALWLVDWYSSPAAKAALPKRVLLSKHSGQALVGGHMSPEKSSKHDPQRLLSALFTTSAQHAIVAWGFQHIVKSQRNTRRFLRSSPVANRPPFQWTWGLHLLRKLRERGVRIEKRRVARICRHRLNTLFGPGLSKRNINRRARLEQKNYESYSESVYIRKMEAIWGKDLFRVWRPVAKKLGQRIIQKGPRFFKLYRYP
ncbi:hypothetical protein BDR22DRAFT_805526 [Usnea florida]